MNLQKRIIYISGLPRAGSTLMCQLLAQHPEIYSTGHSSPLCSILKRIRHTTSDMSFLLAQLDNDFELVHQRLLMSFRGFINGWFEEAREPFVVDKNRGWLKLIETVQLLDPEFRMIVLTRDLKQIFGSIEAQHRKTQLIEFPDHIDPDSAANRAHNLFSNKGVIGGPLRSIEQMLDIEDDELRGRICYVDFDELITNSKNTMAFVYNWLELDPIKLDIEQLTVRKHESDSHYHFKFPHKTYSSIKPHSTRSIPKRIDIEIEQGFKWFYEQFYPDKIS